MDYTGEFMSSPSLEEYKQFIDSETEEQCSDDELEERMLEDQFFFDSRRSFFYEDLQREFEKMDTVENLYLIKGQNVNWRHESGERLLKASSAKQLFDSLAPDQFGVCEYTYKNDTLHLKISSHDVPTGAIFEVIPVSTAVAQAYNTHGEKKAIEEFYG